MTQGNWLAAVEEARPKFQTIAQNTGDLVNWKTESNFAIQVMKGSKALQGCPLHTIQDAMVNVAAIGLSLNPAQKLAYLVPRDGKACLDISYQGLLKLATDTGVVQWAKAILVRQGDEFVWNGFDAMPDHKELDPFNTGREVIGAYVVAKLRNNDLMCEKMSAEELDKIKNSSKAKNGPWKTWPEEMMKKSIIKRAYKSWPKSASDDPQFQRMGEAIEVLNQHDGLDDRPVIEAVRMINDDQLAKLNELIEASHINPEKILAGFEIEALMDMPADRFDECLERLEQAKAAYDKKQDGEATDGDFLCTECSKAPVREEGMACEVCLEGIDNSA